MVSTIEWTCVTCIQFLFVKNSFSRLVFCWNLTWRNLKGPVELANLPVRFHLPTSQPNFEPCNPSMLVLLFSLLSFFYCLIFFYSLTNKLIMKDILYLLCMIIIYLFFLDICFYSNCLHFLFLIVYCCCMHRISNIQFGEVDHQTLMVIV